MQSLCGSLTQLLFYRDQVVGKLVEHMNRKDVAMAAAPLCALTATLVRDLGEEMAPHFAPLFVAMIGLLARTADIESVEVVLGSLFFFVKHLVSEVDSAEIITHLVSALQGNKIRPQVQDFLAEFTCFVLRRSFDEALLGQILDGLVNEKRDLCVVIIAGALDAVLEKSKAQSIKSPGQDRLKRTLLLIGKQDDAFELTHGLLLSLIDRTGASAVWSMVAKILDDRAIDPCGILQAIPDIAARKGGRLIEEHSALITTLLQLDVQSGRLLPALVSILKGSDFDIVFSHRPVLQSRFVAGCEELSLLVREVPDLVDALVGSSVAAKILAEALSKGNVDMLFVYDELVKHVSNNPTVLVQVLSAAPVDSLLNMLRVESLALQVKHIALSILSQIPLVAECDFVDSLLEGTCTEPIDHRLVLLKAGWRFITGRRIKVLITLLKPHLHLSLALELLNLIPQVSLEAALLMPILSSSDGTRRVLALRLLSRTDLSSSSLFQESLSLEQIPWTFNSDREKGLRLQTIGNILKRITSNPDSAALEIEVVTRHLVGILLHGFQPLEKDLWATLAVLIEHYAGITKRVFLSVLATLCGYPGPMEKPSAPSNVNLRDGPFFAELCLNPLFAFLAHRPSTSDLVISGLLPAIAHVFEIECPLPADGPISPWFSRAVYGSLGNVLAAMSGMRSINGDAALKATVSKILHRFLYFADASIQRQALDSIIALGLYGGIGLYGDRLRHLLDDAEMRDELVHLATEQGDMPSSETWDSLCPLLIHILYGRMVAKKNTGAGRNSMESRRKLVLNYIATWSTTSLHEFILFLGTTAAELGSSTVKRKAIIGFLTLLQTVLAKIGKNITKITVDQILSWIHWINDSVGIVGPDLSDDDKIIKNLLVKRLYDVYLNCPALVDLSEWTERNWQLVAGKVAHLESEFVKEASTLLDLLHFWAADPRYFDAIALGVGAAMWPRLAASLGVAGAKDSVMVTVIDISRILLVKALDESHDRALAVLSDLVVPLCQALSTRISVILAAPRKNILLLDKVAEMLLKLSALIQDNVEQKTCLITLLLQLLPLKKGIHEESKTHMLQLAAALYVPTMHQQIYSVACGLLSVLKERAARFALSQLFSGLATHEESLRLFASVLEDLHAPSLERIGEYDYDRQSGAFGRLRAVAQLEGGISEQQWIPILQAMFYFCHDEEDTAARTHAFSIISYFVRQVVLNEAWYPTLNIQLYGAVKRGLKSQAESVRGDFLTLLSQLATTFGGREPFAALAGLLGSGNDDVNIFLNLLHLQQHRRARVLKRLAEFARTAPSLSNSSIEDILLPILRHFVFSDPASRDPVPSMVVHEATMAMAALCARLPPKVIVSRTVKLAAQIRKKAPCENALVKLIPAIFGNMRDGLLTDAQTKLLLGLLFDMLLSKGDVVRSPMAISIAALLQTMHDASARNGHIPRLISTLAAMLVNRHSEKREEARETLAAVIERLGAADYLVAILRELCSVLSGGYRPHLLAFTLHYILTKVRISPGTLEEAAELIVSVIIDDVFGSRAGDKDAKEWTGKMMEIKMKKSPDSLCLLIAGLPLNSLLGSVLIPLRNAVAVRSRTDAIESICKAIEEGLYKQVVEAKAPLSSLLPILYSLLDGNSSFYKSFGASLRVGSHWSLHSARFQLVASKTLLHLVKQPHLRSQISTTTLVQLVPIFIAHVHGPSTPLITAALKCLASMLADLQTLPEEASDGFLEKLFSLVISSDPHRHSELIAACFKLIATLVRDRDDVQLTEQQLKALLAYIRNNLEGNSTLGSAATSTAYILIRSILRRQVMLPEVYDLMRVVQRTMMRSFHPSVRQQCRTALLTFLLSYPLARVKLDEHFSFLIANLTYEADGGRESVALFLGSLLEKIPVEVAHEMGESVLVALTVRLANEENEKVQEAVMEAVHKTVVRFDARGMDRCGLLLKRWLASPSAAVRKTAWTVAPLLIRAATVPVTSLVSLLVANMSGADPTPEMMSSLVAIISKCPSASALDRTVEVISQYKGREMLALFNQLRGEYFVLLASHFGLEDVNELSSSSLEALKDHQAPTVPTIVNWSWKWLQELREIVDQSQVTVAEQIVKNLIFVARLLARHADSIPADPKTITTCVGLLEKMEKIYRQLDTRSSPLFVQAHCVVFATNHLFLGIVNAKVLCCHHPRSRLPRLCPRRCALHANCRCCHSSPRK